MFENAKTITKNAGSGYISGSGYSSSPAKLKTQRVRGKEPRRQGTQQQSGGFDLISLLEKAKLQPVSPEMSRAQFKPPHGRNKSNPNSRKITQKQQAPQVQLLKRPSQQKIIIDEQEMSRPVIPRSLSEIEGMFEKGGKVCIYVVRYLKFHSTFALSIVYVLNL